MMIKLSCLIEPRRSCPSLMTGEAKRVCRWRIRGSGAGVSGRAVLQVSQGAVSRAVWSLWSRHEGAVGQWAECRRGNVMGIRLVGLKSTALTSANAQNRGKG